MILIAGVDNYMNASMETTTFFGALFGFVALLLVLFLYINRKWCFNNSTGLCCDEKSLPSKYVHKMARQKAIDGSNTSDSEEEILRRLRMQQSGSFHSGQLSNYGVGPISPNYNDLQHVTVTSRESFNDPLGVAERGKVGVPPSSSECSSNSSVEASVESNMGLVNGTKKDRRLITLAGRSFDSNSTSTTLRETRIDNRIERRNSTNSGKYRKIPPHHQDSLDDVPDLSNNNQDCIVVLSQEPLFDTSDLKSIKSDIDTNLTEASSVGRYGTVEISLLYDAPMRKMTVHVIQARGIPSRESGQQTHTQVRLLMLPSKKQKHKTKIRTGENPQFIESFLLHRVNPEEVNSMGLRVRVYGCERMRRERLIGESIVSFASIDLELETNLWLSLEPKTNSALSGSSSDLLSLARSDSTGSTTSMQHGGVPELLLALAYNGTTGRLTVEVVKGSHFRNLSLNKAPDTYVKLCLVSSMGQEMARAKTSTRRGQPNPLFKETFVFQVALFQLNDVTLMISIYAKRNMKRNEMVGWFSLGLNSSGPEEMAHWTDMRETTRGELLARWHVLVDS